MIITINSKIKNLVEVMSKDNYRSGLQQIAIRDNEAMTTNSYMLVKTNIIDSDKKIEEAYISKKAIDVIKNNGYVEITDDKEIARDAKTGVKLELDKNNDNFPAKNVINSMFTEAKNNQYTVMLGIDTLLPLVNLMKKSKNNRVTLQLNTNDSNKTIYGKLDDYEVLLMPARL